ncbi:hypothetical protein POTOM_042676 [Populus tomentosa]|uniref:Uncharacterized protein n=1 Tax=Populus tomentosa TaxID=118781 RepID=A0A8X7YKS7_POPTO|nr:hypothetical protein POTOM_042676 [Populus tomentosa]
MGKGGGPNLRRQKRKTIIKSEDQRQEDTILATKKGSRRNENLRHEEKRRVKTKLSETGATEMENTLIQPKMLQAYALTIAAAKNVSLSFLATVKPKDAALMTTQANGGFTILCALKELQNNMEAVKLASCHEKLAHQFIEAERAFSDTKTYLTLILVVVAFRNVKMLDMVVLTDLGLQDVQLHGRECTSKGAVSFRRAILLDLWLAISCE